MTTISYELSGGERLNDRWYDAEFERAQLTMDDAAWLADLRGQPVDETWLEETNRLVALGSIGLCSETEPATRGAVLQVRQDFFGQQLGWEDKNHLLHGAYETFCKLNATMTPLVTVIATQRVLADRHIKAARVIKALPLILSSAPEATRVRIDNLSNLGLDAAKIIDSSPAVLGYAPASVCRRVGGIGRVCRLLGWLKSPVEFINTFPAVLGYSDRKLLVHAHLFAAYGQPDLTTGEVQNMIISPPEAHLLALNEPGDYALASVRRVRRAFKGPERKARVAELIDDPDFRRRAGEKVIRSYERYASRGKAA